MGDKTKFIIIGLIGIAVVCIFLYIQTLSSKQAILRERDDLEKENASLSAQLAKLQESVQDYENKAASLNRELERVSREKSEFDKKYDLVKREKEELSQKLKEVSARAQTAQAPPPSSFPSPAQGMSASTEAYWAGILQAKTDLEIQLANVRSELRAIQNTSQQLQREKSALELDLNNVKRENEDLARQIDYNKKLMDSISEELVRERNDKMQIQDSDKSIRNENALLTRQAKNLEGRRAELEKKIQELQEKNASVERKFSQIQTALSERLSQITSLKERLEAVRPGEGVKAEQPQKKEFVELPPIVVRPKAEAVSGAVYTPTELLGTVLEVRRDGNFVIIDLGKSAGINAGDIFQVLRDGKSVATIEVIKTGLDVSACDIRKENLSIQKGDVVR